MNTFETFDEAYFNVLFKLLFHPQFKGVISRIGNSSELTQYSFILKDPMAKFTMAPARNFKFEFAEKFFKWIWDGESDISKLVPTNENAEKYMDKDMKGRNTSYGPRLVEQKQRVIDELLRDPYSRRASILILYPTDSEMLLESWEGKTKQEFPCTIALQFLIRNEALDLHVLMRSNNAVTTLCYDVYNFTRIQFEFLKLLRNNGLGLDIKLGHYYHSAVSMHLFDKEREMAEKIVEWYIKRSYPTPANGRSDA